MFQYVHMFAVLFISSSILAVLSLCYGIFLQMSKHSPGSKTFKFYTEQFVIFLNLNFPALFDDLFINNFDIIEIKNFVFFVLN